MVAVQTWKIYLALTFLLLKPYDVECQINAFKFQDTLREVRSLEKMEIPSELEDISSNKDLMRRIQVFMSNVQADSYNISSQCRNDTDVFMKYWPEQTYARQMFVSFGDLPEIIRQFETTWCPQSLGQFDVCRAVEPEAGLHSFGAEYCTATVAGLFKWAVCFPESCNGDDVSYILSEGGGLPVDSTVCYTEPPYTTGDYICIVICSILVALMILGTGYDVIWHRKLKRQLRSLELEQDGNLKQKLIDSKMTVGELKKKKPGYFGQFLISFSVITNGRKLLSTEQRGSSTISAINGIRVISMFWVMLGHSLSFGIGYFSNNRYVIEIPLTRFSYMAVYAGVYAVDTFFLLSACLVSYLTLKQIYKNKGKLNWALFYFHRWWRLTPAFALTVLLSASLVIHIGTGPMHNKTFLIQQELCQKYWWAALLYFNNFYPWPGNLGEMCLGHTWYLQVDMQLFIISPIFLILIYKSFVIGTSVMAFSTVASIAVVAGLSTYFGFPIGGYDSTYYNDNYIAGDDWTYAKPYSRLQVYVVGIFLGYVLCRLNGKQIKLNKVVNLLCWALAAGVALTIVYGLYPTTQGAHPDQWIAVLYLATSRFAFVVAVAWVIFACATGNGGPVNVLLSWNAWIPLARLTYCAYLIHIFVMFLYNGNIRELIHYTDITTTYIFIANVVVSYLCAFVYSLAIESPMIGLEKLIFRR
ncbi:nose resistant to fluoxetine protein 6-like [Glandiceps talaboti]